MATFVYPLRAGFAIGNAESLDRGLALAMSSVVLRNRGLKVEMAIEEMRSYDRTMVVDDPEMLAGLAALRAIMMDEIGMANSGWPSQARATRGYSSLTLPVSREQCSATAFGVEIVAAL